MQIFKKMFWTDLRPIFNTFFSQHELIARAFRMDRVTIFSNGQPEPFERITFFFFFFCERIAWVTRRITWHFFFERIARAVHVIYANKSWTTCSTRRFAVSSCHFVVSSRRLVAPVSSFPCFDLSLDKSFRLFEVLFRCFVSPIWLR